MYPKNQNYMKRIFFLSAIVFLFVACNSQKDLNKVVFNQDVNQKILYGKIDRKGLKKAPFKKWFNEEYSSYTPDAQTIEELKKYIPSNAKIVIVMATWCPDSRREVPRFFKILDEIGFDQSKVTMYGVNRQLMDDKGDVAQFQIQRVPTFIYYHYGYEAGRIIETPNVSLEKDLLQFTQRKGGKK
jgi:thiol-disulfide isomerase/thioredoxin